MKIYNKKLIIVIQIKKIKETRTDGLSIPSREHSKCKGPEVGPVGGTVGWRGWRAEQGKGGP